MKAILFGAIAAVGLALGVGTSDASAAWVTRTVQRFDPACGHYVTVQEPVWVPDVEVVPAPVYYRHHHRHARVIIDRPFFRPDGYFRR